MNCRFALRLKQPDALHTGSGWDALQAVALFGPGVGRVQQRHAALRPQQLDLVKMLPDVGGLLRRDTPTMRQPPLHLAPTASLGQRPLDALDEFGNWLRD